jgi:gliding motility-associated-like protein
MRTIFLVLSFLLVIISDSKAQTGVCDSLVIPNVITPNNDGFNDFWVIECIEYFPDNEVQVYNRWGQIIYQAYGYDNNWNGTWDKTKGDLPDGSYVYIIKLNKVGEEKNITGSLTVTR